MRDKWPNRILLLLLLFQLGLIGVVLFSVMDQESQIAFSENPASSFLLQTKAEGLYAFHILPEKGYGPFMFWIVLARNPILWLLIGVFCLSLLMVAVLCFQIHRIYQQEDIEQKRILEAMHQSSAGKEDLEPNLILRDFNRQRQEWASEMDFRELSNIRYRERTENTAHQLKSSLAALSLRLDLLEEEYSEDEQLLEKSIEQLERCTSLTQQFLKESISNKMEDEYHFETQDLARIILQAVEAEKAFAGTKGAEILFQPSCIMVCIDGFMMQQVVSTLIHNAISYGEKNAPVRVDLIDSPDSVEVHIRNRGKNLQAEQIEKLMERYVSHAPGSSHYGIGLHMAKNIVEAHFGTLVFSSHDDRIELTITLPKTTLETISYGKMNLPVPDESSNRQKVTQKRKEKKED